VLAVRGYGIRAIVLACAACGLVLAAGYALAGFAGLAAASGLIFALGWLIYFLSERMVLAALRARPVSEVENPALYGLVLELCRDARLPGPRLFRAPAAQPNILTVGCSARSFAVCCTDGLLRSLSLAELRAVLAHELAHVSRRDTLVASWSAGLAALVSFLPLPASALVVSLITPSGREFEADFDGALLGGDPMALASALRKISASAATLPLPARGLMSAAGHLMIAHPFSDGGLGRLCLTHPPVLERVRRLESLADDPRLPALPVVDELEGEVEVFGLEQGDDGLQVVLLLRRHP
jgi:heat shock protein HtpX